MFSSALFMRVWSTFGSTPILQATVLAKTATVLESLTATWAVLSQSIAVLRMLSKFKAGLTAE